VSTKRNLIAALQKECRADQMRVEDFLEALSDLCTEALKSGKRFNLGFGAIFAVPRRENGKMRPMLHFKASRELCAALDIPDLKYPGDEIKGDICPTCRIRKVQKSKKCSTCLYHDWMKKRGHTVKPRGKLLIAGTRNAG